MTLFIFLACVVTILMFGYIARKSHHIHNTLERIMSSQNQLNAKIDELQATVDAVQLANKTAADAQAQLIADLRAQLATGPAGLTEAQVNEAIDRLTTIVSDLQSADTPVEG